MNQPLTASRTHREEKGMQILGEFMELLALPNVTGRVDDLRVNAEELAQRFERRRASMEVVEIPGASPALIGELRTTNPTATIGVYVHYDGQPVSPEHWASAPFDPTVRSESDVVALDEPIDPELRIYARGASDDKTPFAAITGALDALEFASIERTIDLVFLFEGEEESGSPNLGKYMSQYSDRLQADAWLLCDGPIHQSRRPQIGFGCRGYSGLEVTIYGPERELHSGHYGNWAPNPAFELARFLASCKDEAGRVIIEGFYDDTAPISPVDRAAIDALPDVEDQLLDELGFGATDGPWGYGDSLMFPSFNVRGIRSADVGEDGRNVVPSSATVSIDIRLAAGDDPSRMGDRVQNHLEALGYNILDHEPTREERRESPKVARITRLAGGYRAARIPMESDLATILLECAGRASGEEVVALPTFGGSIPLYLFEDILGAPVACVPIANHDNNQHAANENIRIGNIWYGMDLWATLLTSDFGAISETGRAD